MALGRRRLYLILGPEEGARASLDGLVDGDELFVRRRVADDHERLQALCVLPGGSEQGYTL